MPAYFPIVLQYAQETSLNFVQFADCNISLKCYNKDRKKRKGYNKMTESRFWNEVEERHIVKVHVKKAKQAIVKENADRMTANGADAEIAKVLAKVFYEYEV